MISLGSIRSWSALSASASWVAEGLEEAEFFVAQGLYDDALASLEDLREGGEARARRGATVNQDRDGPRRIDLRHVGAARFAAIEPDDALARIVRSGAHQGAQVPRAARARRRAQTEDERAPRCVREAERVHDGQDRVAALGPCVESNAEDAFRGYRA